MKKVFLGVFIGLALCALGFGLWKVYDKKDNNEKGNDDYEKITFEKVNELYSMVTEGKFYYKEKVTTSSNQLPLLKYALKNYIKDNNITGNKIFVEEGKDKFYILNEYDNLVEKNLSYFSEKDGVINKEKFNNYVKEKYNIKIDDANIPIHGSTTSSSIFDLSSSAGNRFVNTKDNYVIVSYGGNFDGSKLYSKMIDYKEDKDYVYIYDKAVIKVYESGTLYLEKYIGGYDTATFYCGFSECGNLKELTDDEINNQMVNKYKHTFKKNSDKTYSFVSSEYLGN